MEMAYNSKCIRSAVHGELLVDFAAGAVALGLDVGAEHGADGHLCVLADGLLAEVHLGVR